MKRPRISIWPRSARSAGSCRTKITRISIAHRSELAEAADVMLCSEGPDWETSIRRKAAIVPGAASEVRRNLASTPAG